MSKNNLTKEALREEEDLERFEDKQVQDYFQYAFDADNNAEADEAVKELLKMRLKAELDLRRPIKRVVSSTSGSPYRDALVDGQTPVLDVNAKIRAVAEKKLKIINKALAALQAIYKEKGLEFPKLSAKEIAKIQP